MTTPTDPATLPRLRSTYLPHPDTPSVFYLAEVTSDGVYSVAGDVVTEAEFCADPARLAWLGSVAVAATL